MTALQRALEEVYGGDQSLEANAVTDKLEDQGCVLVPVGFRLTLTEVPPRRRRWPWSRR